MRLDKFLKVSRIIKRRTLSRTILTVKVKLLKEHVLKDESTMLYDIVDEKRKEVNE